MPTRQQVRARQHQLRRRQPDPAAQTPVIQRGLAGLKLFAAACEAYETDMAAAFAARTDAIGEAWADYQSKAAAAEAEYERAAAAAGAAYEQRTADSHAPDADEADEPDEPDDAGEPDVHR